jgi:hypothetical protein
MYHSRVTHMYILCTLITVLCKLLVQWKDKLAVALKCLIQLYYKLQRLTVYIVTETGALSYTTDLQSTVYTLHG